MDKNDTVQTILLADAEWSCALRSSLERLVGTVRDLHVVNTQQATPLFWQQLIRLAEKQGELIVFCQQPERCPPQATACGQLHVIGPVTVPMLLHFFCGEEQLPLLHQLDNARDYAAEQCLYLNHAFAMFRENGDLTDRS